MREVTLPAWMLDHPGEHFLVVVRPDGLASIDGGHSDPAGVAKAQLLHERIAVIRPPEGSRYVMVTVSDVPPYAGGVNEQAVRTLNAFSRRPPPGA